MLATSASPLRNRDVSPHPPLSLKARSFLLHLDRDFEEAVEGIRGVLPLARILERRHAVHLVDATTRRVRPSLVQLRGTRDPPTRPPPERASVLWGTVLLNHAPTGLTHDKTPHTQFSHPIKNHAKRHKKRHPSADRCRPYRIQHVTGTRLLMLSESELGKKSPNNPILQLNVRYSRVVPLIMGHHDQILFHRTCADQQVEIIQWTSLFLQHRQYARVSRSLLHHSRVRQA